MLLCGFRDSLLVVSAQPQQVGNKWAVYQLNIASRFGSRDKAFSRIEVRPNSLSFLVNSDESIGIQVNRKECLKALIGEFIPWLKTSAVDDGAIEVCGPDKILATECIIGAFQ